MNGDTLWECDNSHKIEPQENIPTLKVLKDFETLEVRYMLRNDNKQPESEHEESGEPKISCKLHITTSEKVARLSVTDPIFRDKYQITSENATFEEQVISLDPDKTVVVASLTKPRNGYQHMIAATIIELA